MSLTGYKIVRSSRDNARVILKGHRVTALDGRLPGIASGVSILPAFRVTEERRALAERAGFEWPLTEGDSVLPNIVGPRSRFNAEGGEIIHKDRPKEQVWKLVWARWLEWRGPYSEEQFGVKPRAYWSYPRTPIPAPAIPLRVASTPDGVTYVVGQPLAFGQDDPDLLTHEINLFLELFQECEVLSEELEPLLGPPSRTLNWRVLPRGRRPWEQLQRDIGSVTDRLEPDAKEVAEYRLRLMHSFGPDFQAYGRAGFRGYIVFGFEQRGLYVLESLYTGNATYIFGESWETLSQMTKAEIIAGGLATERVVHTPGWERRLKKALAA